jgi:hypothetical protein
MMMDLGLPTPYSPFSNHFHVALQPKTRTGKTFLSTFLPPNANPSRISNIPARHAVDAAGTPIPLGTCAPRAFLSYSALRYGKMYLGTYEYLRVPTRTGANYASRLNSSPASSNNVTEFNRNSLEVPYPYRLLRINGYYCKDTKIFMSVLRIHHSITASAVIL